MTHQLHAVWAFAVTVVCLGMISGDSPPQVICPCRSHEGCIRPEISTTHEKEVIVMTNETSAYVDWDWKTVTTVISTVAQPSTNLMCYAHTMKKKFGFTVSFPSVANFNVTSQEILTWLESTSTLRKNLHADVVVMDVNKALHNQPKFDMMSLITLLNKLRHKVRPNLKLEKPVKMVCIMPWKPPCHEDDCTITTKLGQVCDWIMLSPQSYNSLSGYGCKARGTIPVTKVSLGVDEYVSQGIEEKRQILGIPWYGYDYRCVDFNYGTKVCDLDKKTTGNETRCDTESSRSLISLGEIVTHWTHRYEDHQWDPFSKAPHFDYYNNTTRKFHQVWFEDNASLKWKYAFAHDFGLKGVSIWTAEDLSYAHTALTIGFSGGMWSWVLHGIFTTSVTKEKPSHYEADAVAGTAVGCLIGGALLGMALTCVALRHRGTKKQPPFMKDADDYHDEDFSL